MSNFSKRATMLLVEEKLRQLAVMQAALAGKPVQYRYHDQITDEDGDWRDCEDLPSDWFWNMMEYRIKPEDA